MFQNATIPTKRKVGRPHRYVRPEEIRALRDRGLSFRAISRATGLGYGTVRRAFYGQPPYDRPEAVPAQPNEVET